jgi:hypothetical protein
MAGLRWRIKWVLAKGRVQVSKIPHGLRLGLSVWAVGLGCSSPDFCQRIPDVENAAINKFAPCNDGGLQLPIIIPPTAQCEARLASCSSSDKAALNKFADCVEGLPACMPGHELTWGLQGFVCVSGLQGLSSACTSFTADAGH